MLSPRAVFVLALSPLLRLFSRFASSLASFLYYVWKLASLFYPCLKASLTLVLPLASLCHLETQFYLILARLLPYSIIPTHSFILASLLHHSWLFFLVFHKPCLTLSPFSLLSLFLSHSCLTYLLLPHPLHTLASPFPRPSFTSFSLLQKKKARKILKKMA